MFCYPIKHLQMIIISFASLVYVILISSLPNLSHMSIYAWGKYVILFWYLRRWTKLAIGLCMYRRFCWCCKLFFSPYKETHTPVCGLETARIHVLTCAFHFAVLSSLFMLIDELGLLLFQWELSVLNTMALLFLELLQRIKRPSKKRPSS